LQADNAQKTEQITTLTARLEAERLAREAQDQRMAEMMRVLAALGQHTGVDVTMSATAPQLPTPFSSTVSVKVNFFFVTVVQK
jgi:septal ring factor EnvC (AmiA/AmiB activator)